MKGKVLTDHWDGWIDQKLPALGGKTPRQAVKTPDGKESVEALLLDASRHMNRDDEMAKISLAAIENISHRLGLNETSGKNAKGVDKDKTNEKIESIDSMIETFGRRHLNTLYTDLAFKLRQMITGSRKLSIQRGRVEIWAGAIIYAIAQLNFLFDPEMEICISPDEICEFFGAKKSTVSNKAGQIRKELDLYYGHPDICTPELIEKLSFYETEDGFLIPGALADELIPTRPFGLKNEHPKEEKLTEKKKRGTKQTQKNDKPESTKEREEEHVQLGLFDDI